MANIPIPDIPSVSGTPYQAARLDADAAMAPARGMMAIGQGIQQVGAVVTNEIARFQAKTRAAQERKAVDDLEIAKDALQKDFATWQETNTDETKWLEEWQTRTSKLGDVVGEAKIRPEVRDQLNEHVRTWTALQDTAVNNQAIRYSNAKAKASLEQNIENRIVSGDFDQARQIVEEGGRIGHFSKAQIEAKLWEISNKEDIEAAVAAASNEPQMAATMLDARTEGGKYKYWKTLSASQRAQLKRASESQQESDRHDNFQSFVARIGSGNPAHWPTDKEYEQMQTTGGLLPTQISALKQIQGQGKIDFAGSHAVAISNAIDAWDVSDKAQKFRLLTAIAAEPDIFKQQLLQDIETKERPASQAQVKEDPTVRAGMKAFFDRNGFGPVTKWTRYEIQQAQRRPRSYGLTSEQAAGLTENSYKDPVAAEQAATRYFDVLADLRAEIEKRKGNMPVNEQHRYMMDRLGSRASQEASSALYEAMFDITVNEITGEAQ